jgi:2-keto-3-deoxy-L-rhamnonate aldolase RhmA
MKYGLDNAKAAVSICKYPPTGCRSMTGQQPIFRMKTIPMEQTIEQCNRSASTVFAMIESKHGVDAADEIAAVEGVDVLLVGSADLSVDLGVPGQFKSDVYRKAVERVAQACRSHGKVLGAAGVYENEEIQDWFINTLGARFVLVQQDGACISSGGARAVDILPKVRG